MTKILHVLGDGIGIERWSGKEDDLAIFVGVKLVSNFGGYSYIGLIGERVYFNSTGRIVLVCTAGVSGLDGGYGANRSGGAAALVEVVGCERIRVLAWC